MIEDNIRTIVESMDANGDTFTFLHSDSDWKNLRSDEVSLPVIFLDFPIIGTPEITGAGSIRDRYRLNFLILYKTQLDDTPEQVKEAVNKAHVAKNQLILKLYNDRDSFDEVTPLEFVEVQHLFDTDLSGVKLPINLYARDVVKCP